MAIPSFKSKSELFKFLKENKSLLISEKKSKNKNADTIAYKFPTKAKKDGTFKAIELNDSCVDFDCIKASVVINTTNILDSHGDVHIPGIWKKSLSEKKIGQLLLLQEHNMKFDSVITSDLVAYTKILSWSELGFSEFKGTTEALIFDANIDEDRNEFMFDQYIKGYVNNHSVGMQYVNLFLCINSEDRVYKEEKTNWDKYISQVVNSQDAIDAGYFWAVTEAKVVEGSAVVMGSNQVTPTMSITIGAVENESECITCGTTTQSINTNGTMTCLSCGTQKNEPLNNTRKGEPLKDTRKNKIKYLTDNFKIN